MFSIGYWNYLIASQTLNQFPTIPFINRAAVTVLFITNDKICTSQIKIQH